MAYYELRLKIVITIREKRKRKISSAGTTKKEYDKNLL